MREEYNEVYGYLPQEIINKLSEVDRTKLFFRWLKRKPTATGWFIARTVIEAMGEEFITYMINGIIESLQEDGGLTPTKETVVESLSILMETFATDSNILNDYIHTYRTEVLGLDEETLDEDPQPETKTEEKKASPKRDAKGRFIKSK